MMIEAVLKDYLEHPVEGMITLDIGCGNGGISDYFSMKNSHFAVDVEERTKIAPISFDWFGMRAYRSKMISLTWFFQIM